MLVSETDSMGEAGWERASVWACRQNQGTEVSIAVMLDVGVRDLVQEEHLALSGDSSVRTVGEHHTDI